jgi:photosystem II stability/assembly factor-like uncharacterized protein
MNRQFLPRAGAAALLLALASHGIAQHLNEALLNGLAYRNLGPFRAGAWTVAVAVPEAPEQAHRTIIYAALRTGGVWKSSNGGTTFEPVLDGQNIYSMGAIAVAPSDPNIVWAGTGDNSATRSAYWGDGVYKTTNGGQSWQNMGLKDTQHIARIVIHPTRPDTVFVAALGHLSTPNRDRGVFRTTDGGRTWKNVLFVGDRVGAVDLVRDFRNPDVLYAATYEHLRLPWVINDGGPGTGIYKTTDGGDHWTELTNGLPKGPMGRIGLDICRSKPDTLYAIYDNHNLRAGATNPMATINGQVYRTDDAGASWRRVNPDNIDPSGKAGYSFNQLTVDPNNPERFWITGSNFNTSSDGGKTWAGRGAGGGGGGGAQRFFGRAFGDFRSLWVDPQDSDHIIATSDGGVFISRDGGRTNQHCMTIRGGEVYALGVDMEKPYNIYAGLQDHESWKGPSNGWTGSVGIEDWVTVGIGDGMYNQVDFTDSRWVYNTQEFGGHGRYDQKTHIRTRVAPTRPQGQPPLRFNWIAPFVMSPHSPTTLYAGAQVLLKTTDRGDHWQEISPDLTGNDPEKTNRSAAGSAIQYCTIVTISESPAKAGVIWVGTDDGKVQVTQNGGTNWTDVTKGVAAAGGPEDVWTSRVYASRFAPGTAYVAKTGRRTDNFKPYLFKTTDFGATWTNIASNLPQWPVNVIVEDTQKPSILFAGTDIGVYLSTDTGAHWMPFRSNMPPAPVTDMVVHSREQDLVAGTYGRGIWVADIAPIREMTDENLKGPYLFDVKPKPILHEGAQGNFRLLGDSFPTTPNEPNGLLIYYYLNQDAAQPVTVTVADSSGKVVRTLTGEQRAGLHRVASEAGGGFGGGGGGGRGGQARAAMPPGEYTVTLQAAATKLTRTARVVE